MPVDAGQAPQDASRSSPNPSSTSRPQQLHGEVIPELLRKVGDAKSGRLAKWMVEQYLERNVLIFDRAVLHGMFEEADFKKEGSLNERALGAALSGRYPKRFMVQEWRKLVALIFDIPELVLAEDVIVPKVATKGTFNSETFWDEPPPSLPAIPQRSSMKSSPATGELKTMAAAAAAAVPSPLAGTNSMGMLSSATGDVAMMAMDFERGVVTGANASTSSSSAEAGGSMGAGGGLTMLSSRGVQAIVPSGEEGAVNRSLLQGAGVGGTARCTFGTVREFNKVTGGQEVKAEAALEASYWATGAGRSMLLQSMGAGGASSSYTLPYIAKPQSRIGGSSSLSALQTLRTTVRGPKVMTKPEFLTMHTMLAPTDSDQKKTLGMKMDVSQSLARDEPVRSTTLRYDADYIAVGDYAPNCRTAPTQWDLHPRAPAEAKEPCNYPWGIRS